MATLLDVMAENLVLDSPGCDSLLRIGEPVVVYDGNGAMQATSQLNLSDGSGGNIVATGSSVVTVDIPAGTTKAVIQLSNGSVACTLDLSIAVQGDVLHIWGTATVIDAQGVTVLNGGWTYSTANGLARDSGGQGDFEDEVVRTFGCPPSLVFGPGIAGIVGHAVQIAANVALIGINYFIDLFTPYTPPTTCSGPFFYDGPAQSCEGRDISCKDRLGEMSLLIDGLTGVSDGFKQCMKGRAGCGGSAFQRLKVSCGSTSDCGPCGHIGPAGGCNIAGTRMWYCQDESLDICGSVNTIFHEMAHACGQFDDRDCLRLQGQSNCPLTPTRDPDNFDGACKTGYAMNEQCCDLPDV